MHQESPADTAPLRCGFDPSVTKMDRIVGRIVRLEVAQRETAHMRLAVQRNQTEFASGHAEQDTNLESQASEGLGFVYGLDLAPITSAKWQNAERFTHLRLHRLHEE